MKKILSLVLAVLMLSSLAITASADSKVYSFSDLLDWYKYYSTEKDPYANWGDYVYDGVLYNRWFDTCPTCGGLALFRVVDFSVKYNCVESKCGASGSYSVAPDKDEDDNKADGLLSIDCPDCDRLAYYARPVYIANAKYYEYTCEGKHDTYLKADEVDGDISWTDTVLSPIDCTQCARYAEFDSYFTYGENLYATFACAKGHKTYKLIDGNILDWTEAKTYRVNVEITGGGSYTIDGGKYAKDGEYKTVHFSESYGYDLTKVTINGYPVKVSGNSVTFKVEEDTTVRATFTQAKSNVTVTTTVEGNGYLTATVGNKKVDASKATLNYGGNITYKVYPASSNYTVSSLKVNGKSMSVPTNNTFTVKNVTEDTKIVLTFQWKNPYADLADNYQKSVEYVTEAGIMGFSYADGGKLYFGGKEDITVQTFLTALVEMADTGDTLNNTAERVAWAEKKGIIKEDADLSGICDVQMAAAIVDRYLEILEDINDVDFVKFNRKNSAKSNAISINLVTEKTYDKNRDLCRYDLAAVARLISELKYTD